MICIRSSKKINVHELDESLEASSELTKIDDFLWKSTFSEQTLELGHPQTN
jgi:hypothetical protein